MNVAMLLSTPYPPEEGIGNYVANLSRTLAGRGHEVTVLTRGRFRRSETRDGPVRVVELPCPPVYPFHVDVHGAFVGRFFRRHSEAFDVVHAHTPLTPAVRADIPTVSTVHTSIVEDIKHVQGWGLREVMSRVTYAVSSRRLVAGQAAAADRVTTVSRRVREELDEHYGIADATVVGNGVDTERFHPDDEGDGKYLLYVGRLDYPKGVPDLLEAAASVLDGRDLDLVVTGKGPQREALERQAARLGIAEDVRFTGYISRERQLELYRNATAFVLPSHYEGLPTVLLEAMACGAPVVATSVGGCPDVVEDGVNGLLVEPGAPAALAGAIERLLESEEVRERLGANARATTVDRYTWDAVTDRLVREYRRAVGGADPEVGTDT